MNHPLTVDAQIDHGLNVAGYGAWGFSPSNTPEGGYGAYGVDAAGMDPNGNPSNEDNTLVDRGFAGCPGRDRRSRTRRSPRTRTVWSHRTPRSSRCATGRTQTIADLRRLEAIPTCTASGASATR